MLCENLKCRSAKGAKCNSLGQRPRIYLVKALSAEGAKCEVEHFYLAPSALLKTKCLSPRVLPWAIAFRALGAPNQLHTTLWLIGFGFSSTSLFTLGFTDFC
jgi:hypothetical protein